VARQRLTRKEIKQPDQFISYTVRTLDWAKAHTTQLLYGALGVFVVIALLVAWSVWQTKRQQRAERLLYQAVEMLKLNEPGEQQVAAQDRDVAIQKLKGLVERYPGASAAVWAHWYLGHQYYAQSKYAAALASYRQALALLKHDDRHLLTALVTLNIAYALEASGSCEQAIKSFQSVLQTSWLWLHGEAFLGIGRCQETLGNLKQAQEVYARALSSEGVQGATRQRLEERQTTLSMRLEEAAKSKSSTPAQGASESTASETQK
jgi:predicted negative regulator of RcsB-dependent stress response